MANVNILLQVVQEEFLKSTFNIYSTPSKNKTHSGWFGMFQEIGFFFFKLLLLLI